MDIFIPLLHSSYTEACERAYKQEKYPDSKSVCDVLFCI